ncbi:MAG: putative RNA uridine N3 methyltransferase [Euryarchaeota archaeon]|nr:putative RNA uridine N3 methyltransferase [Euryarchaeota archaeon]
MKKDIQSPMKPRSLSLIIPSSLTIDARDLRSKTLKIGQIARAASVFCVDQITIFRDPGLDEADFIEKILLYAETPQYLRKRLFPLTDDLRYAGAIPPLRTPHHPVDVTNGASGASGAGKANKECEASKSGMEGMEAANCGVGGAETRTRIGEIRAGVVVRAHETGSWVDIGLEHTAFLDASLRRNARVDVRITSEAPLKAVPVSRDEITGYWGYSVTKIDRLSSALTGARTDSGADDAPTDPPAGKLLIATSRYGEPLDIDLLMKVGAECGTKDVSIAFGAPHKGIFEYMQDEGAPISRFDYMVNSVPCQGTETIRVEEAVVATLATLNIAFC